MQRRTFLASSLAAGAASTMPLRAATARRIDRSRISAITDEIAKSPAEALAFAKEYGLKWLELRDVPHGAQEPKRSYWQLDPAELAAAVREFKDAGVRISFLNTSLLKFGLPGTEPRRRTPETPEARDKRLPREQAQFDRRLDDLGKAIRCAHAFDVSLIRVFTFSRIEQPETLHQRVAEILGEMARIAEKEGVKLLIENEGSQNIGTSAEVTRFLKLLPTRTIAINWDSLNSLGLGEKPFPDGYDVLPKDRILNVQIKGKAVLDYPERMEWPPIFRALERDGYQGQLGLETHIFGEGQVAASHASMKEILRQVNLS
jgi:sugar phosphate isomerase/epimerase